MNERQANEINDVSPSALSHIIGQKSVVVAGACRP